PLLFDEQLQAKPAYWGVVDPTRLPPLIRGLTVPYASPKVDGSRDLEWDLLPATLVTSPGGASAQFQVRFDACYLYVLEEVKDSTKAHGDSVEIFLDRDTAKSTTYQADASSSRIRRDGKHPADIKADAKAITGGYRIEAAIPLQVTAPPRLGFDIRFRDA